MAFWSPSRASDISVPVNNMVSSYHKKHMELQASWSRLKLAQDRATTEVEKQSLKRQKEELRSSTSKANLKAAADKAAADERLRELRSTEVFTPRPTPRMRLNLSEVNKKQKKKIKKPSAWASKKAEKWMKEWEEYLREKENGK